MLHFDSTIDIVLFIVEIIGCIAFGTSGAITALRKKADILGVWILTLIAAFGGGLLRDLIINDGVPHIFYDPSYLILAGVILLVSTFWFFIGYFDKTCQLIEKHRNDFIIYLVDAIGVAVFCVYGANAAFNHLPSSIGTFATYVYVTSLGVITGVGGSMFRDIFIGEIPSVFKKHFYMTPCIIGTLIYALMANHSCNIILSVVIAVLIITILRAFATIYHWNLPTAKGYNKLLEAEENKRIDDIESEIVNKINDKK